MHYIEENEEKRRVREKRERDLRRKRRGEFKALIRAEEQDDNYHTSQSEE